MKFRKTLEFHEKVRARLGEDLVYSIAYDAGEYLLAISVHKSKTQQFSHGRNIQSCLLTRLSDPIDKLVNDVVSLFQGVLIERIPDVENEGVLDETGQLSL